MGTKTIWLGRVLSALVVALLLMSASMKVTRNPEAVKGLVGQFGYPETSLIPIGGAEIASAVLYAIPQTAALGAILVTGYLGGATATHVRAGDGGFVLPVIIGVVAWLALWLRDERFRALMPLRSFPK